VLNTKADGHHIHEHQLADCDYLPIYG